MAIPWLLISVLILIIILAVVAIFLRKSHRRPIDYYNFFIIGSIWFVIGLPTGNFSLWAIGLVFIITSLMHKKDWNKNRRRWKDLSKKERNISLIITIILALLVLIGFVALFLF